ncbi:hypothetical protein OEJ37_00925 [Burkholderia sp. BKH01]|uniref:hypothetical protein n=1 Tax=Burkholderia sp. BKH01 TaxID=2769262 RepID=UPI0021E02AB4|nr:hypothetical protein [Burkholderia sp. BKH01]MCU9951916.1 hypothetical protein [Burkholderia sp. BKH01]MCU9951945.1 hypothetical protein [Burkholderia sp. BKH01]
MPGDLAAPREGNPRDVDVIADAARPEERIARTSRSRQHIAARSATLATVFAPGSSRRSA